jgi:hypothetical protein
MRIPGHLGWEIGPSYQIYCIFIETATEFEPSIKVKLKESAST